MKAIEAPKTIEPWRIICAAQSEPDYSEERYMLIYAGDGSDDYYDKGYILLEGWHCSCYDWPEVDWDATYYEEDELLKIADMRKRNPSDSAERPNARRASIGGAPMKYVSLFSGIEAAISNEELAGATMADAANKAVDWALDHMRDGGEIACERFRP